MEQTQQLTNEFTREYRQLVKQFLNFREQTWTVIDKLKDYEDRVLLAEQISCQNYPVSES